MSKQRIIPALLLLAPVLAAVAGARAAERPAVVPASLRDRLELGLLATGETAQWPPLDPAVRAPARIEADWPRIEAVEGTYDWTAISQSIDALEAAGYRPVLALTGSHPVYLPEGGLPAPDVGRSLDAWLGFVRSAARTFAGRVAVLEIAPTDGTLTGEAIDQYALLTKQSALAARAEATAAGTSVWVAQGAIPFGALGLQRELWARDLAAYVDILPVVLGPGDAAATVGEWAGELLLHPPAAALWTLTAPGIEPWDAATAGVTALASGASLALVAAGADPAVLSFTLGLHSELASGYGPAPAGGLQVQSAPGVAWPGARVIGSFFRGADFTSLAVVGVPPLPDGSPEARLVIDPPSVRNVRRVEVGETDKHWLSPGSGAPAGRVFRLAPDALPQLVSYERRGTNKGLQGPAEQLEVAQHRGLTAEEIIARHQERERVQADRLERWSARGRIDFHFKVAQAGSAVDVTIDSTFFWERGRALEWEQSDYYINGNRVKWKEIPEIPLIQPERVMTLPLDLTLDRTYSYRLAGEDRVDGRVAWVLEFQPANPDAPASLYRGRVWIDQATFVRLRASVVQTGLEAPVLSNEETDHYEERQGPDGQPYQMLVRIDGQQNWNVAGRSLAVRREVRFDELSINPERSAFEARRQQAYASAHQMLRETDKGLRYLERGEDGQRSVKETMDTSRLFAAGGLFKDGSIDSVVPLAGVNYLNFDLFGRGVQFNALFAGVLGLVTVSKPDLFGSRIDLTGDAALFALRGDDRFYTAGVENVEERVQRRAQHLALRLGIPAGSFFKLNLIGNLGIQEYFKSDESNRAINDFNAAQLPADPQLEFVLPEDHLDLGAQLEIEFNRRGWSFAGEASHTRRSSFEAWGLRDTLSGQFGHLVNGVFVPGNVDPLRDSSTRWGLSGTKEWYLPKFQKIRASANWLGGADLDRFSRYEFSFFGGDRLSGFSGTGVRFDEGTIARLGYAFNLFEVIRLDAGVETARVKQDDAPEGTQSFSGLGLSGTVVGPWKTVINVSWGYALNSDIPDLEGEQEFMLLVLKLF